MRVLIVGCGYVGIALGRRLLAAGHHVTGIRRSPVAATRLSEAGIDPLILDLADASQLPRLPVAWDWVVHCAAPSESTEAAYRATYLDSARHLIRHFRSQPPRALVFTGSSSVYAQDDGSVVSETSPTSPSTPLVQALLETEELLLQAARDGFPARLLRVAGIYGPGRNRIDGLRSGKLKQSADPTRFLNFIHRDDVASAVEAVLQRGRNGDIYNVSDGHPVEEGELLEWLADALKLPLPGPADSQGATLDPGARRRPLTNKRLDASKIRRELGWEPFYATFREGYKVLLEGSPSA
ncbi:MAG: SDR family oxidoreductase [Verrucomicrobiales bacterium]|nr:SDR family oxidoreductase [Verrucomicrobiales bacterium]